MHLRRLLEPNKSGITFYELLDDICNNPLVITRQFHINLYSQKNIGDKAFNKYAGKTFKDKDFLDMNSVSLDKKNIEEKLNKLKPIIDKIIAHQDKNPPKVLQTYNDIEYIIDFVGTLTKKYYLILKGGSLTTLTPTVQYDWEEIFTEKWIND
ncbi:MAG: AbiU2 domain-containing protein [Candidatus Humimicrobiaceae bacterium]